MGIFLLIIATKVVLEKPINVSFALISIMSAIIIIIVYGTWRLVKGIIIGPTDMYYIFSFIIISLLLQCGTLAVGAWLIYTARAKGYA